MTETPTWSVGRLRALAAVFATFVEPAYEGEAERHAALAAAALNDVAEPADLRQLRLVLALLEAPVGVPSVTGTGSFSRLTPAQRERLMHTWAGSRLGQRRTFFQTVKRLACFFAYADPGPDGVNPRWAPIGYAVPDHPTNASDAVERALVQVGGGSREELRLEAEIVIVGSGAGGGVAAARLAEAGHDVLVVEAGPFAAERSMPVDEMSAFDRLYLDHGMTSTTDLGLAILAGAALGGGTLINWTTCIEPPAEVRAEWTTDHGLADFDGPDMDAELARVRSELGFSPPSSIGAKDRLILDGAAALGWEAAPTERNADGCSDCGACGFGCRSGAKKSGQRLYLAAAAGDGARLLADARVEAVSMRGGRAEGVRGTLRAADGERRSFTVRARVVIVAAGALRTPVVLRRSGLTHPSIGANLHLHPSAIVAGRLAGRVDMWRDTMQAARSLEFLGERVLIESAPGHPGLIALAFPWQDAQAHAALMSDVGHYAPLVGIVRDADGGRVTVSRTGRARIHYRISARDADAARLALVKMATMARAAGAERVVALGTPAAWHDVAGAAGTGAGDERAWQRYLDRLAAFDFRPNRGSLFSAHQMGSARAGSDPRSSACDPWGRVRTSDGRGAVSGLYVADTSLFPTALGVNPMVTAMALAGRVAAAVHTDGG